MIGLYAHHQGAGHLTRCRALARALAPHEEAVILSSHPEADVVLPMDAPADERDLRVKEIDARRERPGEIIGESEQRITEAELLESLCKNLPDADSGLHRNPVQDAPAGVGLGAVRVAADAHPTLGPDGDVTELERRPRRTAKGRAVL